MTHKQPADKQQGRKGTQQQGHGSGPQRQGGKDSGQHQSGQPGQPGQPGGNG